MSGFVSSSDWRAPTIRHSDAGLRRHPETAITKPGHRHHARADRNRAVTKWLDVELPKVQNPRLDLLGETVDGGLVHLELQTTNDAAMPLRMAEYSLGVYRLLGRFPRQVVLYVGEPRLRMPDQLR